MSQVKNSCTPNSNYVLLAEIVKEKSGQSFKAFTDSALFEPLGMDHSFFLDQPYELIKNRAASYYKSANQFTNALHNVFTLGDGGMFSNIEDLSKWVMNYYTYKIGNAKDIVQLSKKGVLNDGSIIPYALGIEVNQYKGFNELTHGGSLAGYRTNISVFPDIKMGFIILSNNGSVNAVAKTNQLADIFLKNYPASSFTSSTAQKAVMKYYPPDTQFIKSISGTYISDDGHQFKFQSNGDSLIWQTGVSSRRLVQTSKEVFEDTIAQVKFKFQVSAKDTIAQQTFPGYNRLLTKYIFDSSFITKDAAIYTGTYFSSELESRVEVVFKDGGLWLISPKHGEQKLQVLDRYNMLLENTGPLRFFTDGRRKL
jgi:hypothetical protein